MPLPDWQIGVVFGFLSTVIACAAKLAIRKSWLINSSSSKDNPRVGALTLRWGGILGISALQPLTSIVAMAHASPALLAPFAGLTLVFIILFSKKTTGEPPRRSQIVGSGLIGVGLVLTVAFGNHTNNENIASIDQLVRFFFFCRVSLEIFSQTNICGS